jgi:phosphoribosylformimino-5-aminoimidazole carboxamide ribotide isomerase
MKNGTNLSLIKKLQSKSSMKIILDPGISNSEEIRIYLDNKIEKLILGLETINNLEIIDESLNLLGKDNVIISIDMYNKKIISQIKRFKNQAPEKLISIMNDLDVENILLLDLYRVGQKYGGIPPIYLKIRNKFQGKTFVGGGIKDIDDVTEYKNQNFSGVLVGTALLDGTISKKEIEKLNNLLY